LSTFQSEKNKVVRVVSESEFLFDGGGKNAVLADSKKEKVLRGNLKSEVCRIMNREEVVILDGLNYIKVSCYGCKGTASPRSYC
jgi:protein KTI12